jgi:hypothetical protein
VFRHSKLKIGLAAFFSGSTVTVLSSTCASCSSLGFLLVSVFGGTGVAASSFLSNYHAITCPFNCTSDMGIILNS